MIKIFLVPSDSELLYQQSLIEREVQELIQSRVSKVNFTKKNTHQIEISSHAY